MLFEFGVPLFFGVSWFWVAAPSPLGWLGFLVLFGVCCFRALALTFLCSAMDVPDRSITSPWNKIRDAKNSQTGPSLRLFWHITWILCMSFVTNGLYPHRAAQQRQSHQVGLTCKMNLCTAASQRDSRHSCPVQVCVRIHLVGILPQARCLQRTRICGYQGSRWAAWQDCPTDCPQPRPGCPTSHLSIRKAPLCCSGSV